MNWKTATYSDINNLCTTVRDNASILHPNLYDFFINIYNTGMRYSDLIDINNFSIIDENQISCFAPKNQNYYTFTSDELTTPLREAIQTNNNNFYFFSYSKLLYYWNRFAGYTEIYSQSKSLHLHLFRHRKAKYYHNIGLSDNDIRLKLAETKIDSARAYIYSVLEMKYF